jgi:XTP/dITP diphosphohydrolase
VSARGAAPDTRGAAHRRIDGRLVVATHNPGKLRELRELLAGYAVEALSAAELGLPEPDETGSSMRENARIKALSSARASGLPALADDSGLAVDALGGAPGIYSARWAGPDKDFRRAMEAVEEALRACRAETAAQRRAHFICALCVAWPDNHVEEFEGASSGTLVWPPRGELGFGYDPMFLPDDQQRTFGEMSAEEKHALPPRGRALSHRARAFIALAQACLTSRDQASTVGDRHGRSD